MFEEICLKNGIIRITTGEYDESGESKSADHPVSYFAMQENYRDQEGILQSSTVFYCKGYEKEVPAHSKFVAEDGAEYDIEASKFIYNHFDRIFEFNKLTVRSWRSK